MSNTPLTPPNSSPGKSAARLSPQPRPVEPGNPGYELRRFELHRHIDGTGVSGTGIVAQGVQFTDGTVVLHWLGQLSSVVVHAAGIENVVKIHGHAGDTEIIWLDEEVR